MGESVCLSACGAGVSGPEMEGRPVGGGVLPWGEALATDSPELE